MSEIQVGQINSTDGSTAITTSSGNTTVTNNLTVTGGFVPSTQIGGRRNLIINGAMQVAQRGTSTTGVTNAAYYSIDRFKWLSSCDDVVTINQSTEAPDGFSNSYHVDITTADTTVSGSSDRAQIIQQIEAQNLQHLKYGTASAQTLTLSFWVRSSVTGTYAVGFYQPDSARFYSSTYVVNSANTWEQKEITISGDASGQIDNNNDSGLNIYFWLAAEPNYTSGSGDTWSASGSGWAAGHNVNVLGDTANNFYLTGVQLEVGTVATPFEHRSYGEELALCQRYYRNSYPAPQSSGSAGQGIMIGAFNTPLDRFASEIDFGIEMRDDPAVVFYGGRSGSADTADRVSDYLSDNLRSLVTSPVGTKKGLRGYFDTNVSDDGIRFHYTADAEL